MFLRGFFQCGNPFKSKSFNEKNKMLRTLAKNPSSVFCSCYCNSSFVWLLLYSPLYHDNYSIFFVGLSQNKIIWFTWLFEVRNFFSFARLLHGFPLVCVYSFCSIWVVSVYVNTMSYILFGVCFSISCALNICFDLTKNINLLHDLTNNVSLLIRSNQQYQFNKDHFL